MSEEKAVENNKKEETTEVGEYEKTIADLKDKLLRAVAENQNLRKVCEKEKSDISKFCISGFAKDILIVRDNLTLAISNCEKDDPILEGIKLTLNELDRILGTHGIKIIEALGNAFDPNLHQAMLEVEDSEKDPGVVVRVMQDGFMINNRLLRPALVGVSKKCN